MDETWFTPTLGSLVCRRRLSPWCCCCLRAASSPSAILYRFKINSPLTSNAAAALSTSREPAGRPVGPSAALGLHRPARPRHAHPRPRPASAQPACSPAPLLSGFRKTWGTRCGLRHCLLPPPSRARYHTPLPQGGEGIFGEPSPPFPSSLNSSDVDSCPAREVAFACFPFPPSYPQPSPVPTVTSAWRLLIFSLPCTENVPLPTPILQFVCISSPYASERLLCPLNYTCLVGGGGRGKSSDGERMDSNRSFPN